MKATFIPISAFNVGDSIRFKSVTYTATKITTNGTWFFNTEKGKEEFQNFKYKDFPSNTLVDNGWGFINNEAIFIRDFDRELDKL